MLWWIGWSVNQFVSKLTKSALSSSPKSRRQLLEITKLPERTLRYNSAILKEQGLVKEISTFSDLRKKIFSLEVNRNVLQ